MKVEAFRCPGDKRDAMKVRARTMPAGLSCFDARGDSYVMPWRGLSRGAWRDGIEDFRARMKTGTALKDMMAQSNHPNRRGHEIVAGELLKWFPNNP